MTNRVLNVKSNDELAKILYESYLKNNPRFDLEEYRCDMKLFVIIGKMLRRYKNQSGCNVKLLINNIVIVHNCFGDEGIDTLHLYIDDDLKSSLYSCLRFLVMLRDEYMEEEYNELLYKEIQGEVN